MTTSALSTEKPFILTQTDDYQGTDEIISMGERTWSLEPLIPLVPDDEDETLHVVVSDANVALNALAEMEENLEARESDAAAASVKLDKDLVADEKKEKEDNNSPIPEVVVEEATEESSTQNTKTKEKKGHAPPRPDEMVCH